jgi:uncharacterized protein YjiS (DUF1127 family)
MVWIKIMANTYHRTQPASGLTAVLGLTLHGAAGRFSAWNEARRTRAILSKLSAQELDDIGLTRGDIDDIAHRGF